MIDRSVVASICVGHGVKVAEWVEGILDDCLDSAATIAGRVLRPELGPEWREFVVDALVAAQLAAAAVDLDHDLDVGHVVADLVRQLAEVAAQAAVDDARVIAVGDAPSAIY